MRCDFCLAVRENDELTANGRSGRTSMDVQMSGRRQLYISHKSNNQTIKHKSQITTYQYSFTKHFVTIAHLVCEFQS
jgi:hypothetical protein